MAGSVNQVTLLGNVGKDPEVRTLQNGDKVVNFSLATSEKWRDKNSGETREDTEWSRFVVWGPLAEVVEKYVRKGSKVYLQGKLKTRKWTDNAGVEKYTTEVVVDRFNGRVVLCGEKREGGGGENLSHGSAPRSGGSQGPIDDDIPFAPSV